MAYNYQIIYDKKTVVESGSGSFDSEDEAVNFALARINVLSEETDKHYESFDYELVEI